jgi:hypothetical protein
MTAKTVTRFDLRGLVHRRVMSGDKIEAALNVGLKRAAEHAVTVFDQTGDLSTAVASMGIDPADELQLAVLESIRAQSVTRKNFLDYVLRAVGGGGITSIPTAGCLYQYLPHDRKPTREEMEAAWEKCKEVQAKR